MNRESESRDTEVTEEVVSTVDIVDSSIGSIPRGIYVPPPSVTTNLKTEDDEAVSKIDKHNHGGYVRIVDAKGKFFPCGFSRPIGTTTVMIVGKKRSRLETTTSDNNKCTQHTNYCDDGDINGTSNSTLDESKETEVVQQIQTITEERLHPEEALFLHLRGLLRIDFESALTNNNMNGDDKPNEEEGKTITLTTQYFFTTILPECEIPLAAYLVYAHLRAQGYILMRYTHERIKLLCELSKSLQQKQERQKQKEKRHSDQKTSCDLKTTEDVPNNMSKELPNDDDKSIMNGHTYPSNSKERYRTRPLRSKLSDDIANAPPPRVISLDRFSCSSSSDDGSNKKMICRLAYHAYNPNRKFKRTNPGLPDFGVAIMPFHSDEGTSEPTFGTLKSLVSMCESGKCEEESENSTTGMPLRVATVADGGAVIVFGVTHGEVLRVL